MSGKQQFPGSPMIEEDTLVDLSPSPLSCNKKLRSGGLGIKRSAAVLASTDDALKKSKDLLQAAQRKNKALKKTVQEIEHELNQTEKRANTTSHNNTTAMELVQKDHALFKFSMQKN